MTDRGQIRELVAKALVGQTMVGGSVFTPLDWDTWDGQYPVLMVRAPSEEKESLGRGAPQFNVVATIQVTGRLQVLADSADIGALKAEALLETLERQVLKAVINFPDLMRILQQHPFIRTRQGFSSGGEQHLAELTVEIGCEFYQGPEDFHPIPALPFEDAHINDPAVFADLAPPELEADVIIPQD